MAKSFQVVLLDLRGHGYSDKPRQIDFKEFADDIIQLLDYLYIDESALIGHEMGATIIADLAERYPNYVSSLIMVTPTSIEVNYLKNVYSENIHIKLETGMTKNKISFRKASLS